MSVLRRSPPRPRLTLSGARGQNENDPAGEPSRGGFDTGDGTTRTFE